MQTRRKFIWGGLLLATGLTILVSCAKQAETGPGKVRWDRMVCERCLMALSDHNYSAQIRGGIAGKPTKLHFFDDLGCAVIWLDQQSWKADPRTEIWVNDYQTGAWIDARQAHYVTGKITPMDFGLGATAQSPDGTLSYSQAVQQIYNARDRKATQRAQSKQTLQNKATQ